MLRDGVTKEELFQMIGEKDVAIYQLSKEITFLMQDIAELKKQLEEVNGRLVPSTSD